MLLALPEGGLQEYGDLMLPKCPSLKQMIQELYARLITDRRAVLMTIVRYDPTGQPNNRYPREIISPPSPSVCCRREMRRMGKMKRGEGGWPYFYKRCQVCGYTVREFVGYTELAQHVSKRGRGRREGLRGGAWRTWIDGIFAE